MLFRFFKGNVVAQIVNVAVDTHANITVAPYLFQRLFVFALFAAYYLRHYENFCSLGQFAQVVEHLINTLLGYGLAAFWTMGSSDAGKKQAQIIVNFRHRADSGARVAARGFLVDGYGGGQAVDAIHVRLVHLPQKLAGVSAQ